MRKLLTALIILTASLGMAQATTWSSLAARYCASFGQDDTICNNLNRGYNAFIGGTEGVVYLNAPTTAAATLKIQAYDTNAVPPAYVTFATLTSNPAPSLAIAPPAGGTLTIDGATMGGTTPIAGTFSSVSVSDSAGAALTGAAGTLTMSGIGAGFDEGLTFDFDTVSNTVGITSATGVTTINFSGIDIATATAGVKISDDGDGAITFLSLGDGSGGLEDLTFNLDDTADTVTVSSSTGVTGVQFTSIDVRAANSTVTTSYATTFNTNVPAAALGISGTGIAAGGTDANIDIDLTPKGSGVVDVTGNLDASGTISGLIETRLDMFNGTVNTDNALVEDCEAGDAAGWTETNNGAWDIADDAVTYKVGSGSLSFTITTAGTPADDDVCYLPVASADWSNVDMIGFWIYSSVSLGATDIFLYSMNDQGGAGTVNETGTGVVAANTWTYLRLDVSGWTRNDIDRIGLSLSATGAALADASVIRIDNVHRWDDTNTTDLAQMPLFGGINGAYYYGDLAANDHTVSAAAENTTYVINRSGTGNEFIPLADLSGSVVWMLYNY